MAGGRRRGPRVEGPVWSCHMHFFQMSHEHAIHNGQRRILLSLTQIMHVTGSRSMSSPKPKMVALEQKSNTAISDCRPPCPVSPSRFSPPACLTFTSCRTCYYNPLRLSFPKFIQRHIPKQIEPGIMFEMCHMCDLELSEDVFETVQPLLECLFICICV